VFNFRILLANNLMMEKETFKPGQLVTLKSGGPVMTVELSSAADDEEVYVSCQWFNTLHELQAANFSLDSIVPYNGQDQTPLSILSGFQ
jgi:uncharacterized protein YodC (DUF2158 family)